MRRFSIETLRRGTATLGVALAALSCLPGDERPEPGSLLVTAEATTATSQGFTTGDGWTVTFDRFVTALGDVDLDGTDEGRDGSEETETCNDYSETNYEWLIDFAAAAGPEKVGLVHGLGSCTIEYRLRGPSDDTVLGAGATEDDRILMDAEGSDPWVEDEEITLLAIGRAERDGVVLTFGWTFRSTYEIRRCADASLAPGAEVEGANDASRVELEGGDAREVQVEVRGEELFRRAATDDAPLQFDLFAAADRDGDGDVTLEELDQVPAPSDALPIPPPGDDPEEPQPPPETMADLVYEVLLPRISRVRGAGACEAELRDRR